MKTHYFGTLFEVEDDKEGGVEISIYVGNNRIDMTQLCVWSFNDKGESLYSIFAKAYGEYWSHST